MLSILYKKLLWLGYPEIDQNGNLRGHVSLRKDTLANLLLVSDAGDGEVAVASDTDSLVVYKGSPSVGVEYKRSALFAGAEINMGSPSLVTGALTQVEFAADIRDEQNIVDVANNEILIPDLENVDSGINASTALEVHFKGVIPATAASYLSIEAQYWNGSSFVAGANGSTRSISPLVSAAVGSPAFINFNLDLTCLIPSAANDNGGRVRLMVEHDDGSNVNALFISGFVMLRNIFGKNIIKS